MSSYDVALIIFSIGGLVFMGVAFYLVNQQMPPRK